MARAYNDVRWALKCSVEMSGMEIWVRTCGEVEGEKEKVWGRVGVLRANNALPLQLQIP